MVCVVKWTWHEKSKWLILKCEHNASQMFLHFISYHNFFCAQTTTVLREIKSCMFFLVENHYPMGTLFVQDKYNKNYYYNVFIVAKLFRYLHILLTKHNAVLGFPKSIS